jgi:hypothetical protein
MNKISTSNAGPGVGIDADPERRPGIPMETTPSPVGHAHWTTPERQEARVRVLKRADLEELTPVFSNANPPRALSGVVRRIAYRIPEHRMSHWLLLLLGDRIDVLEHRIPRALAVALPLAAVGLAWSAWSRRAAA